MREPLGFSWRRSPQQEEQGVIWDQFLIQKINDAIWNSIHVAYLFIYSTVLFSLISVLSLLY